jgi:hypothetical protein
MVKLLHISNIKALTNYIYKVFNENIMSYIVMSIIIFTMYLVKPTPIKYVIVYISTIIATIYYNYYYKCDLNDLYTTISNFIYLPTSKIIYKIFVVGLYLYYGFSVSYAYKYLHIYPIFVYLYPLTYMIFLVIYNKLSTCK